MEQSLRSILGILDEGKRVYRFVSGEVTQEDYQYGQLLDTLLFGEKGYVDTLGSTWDMISDPRFVAIEDAFIVNRRAIFGGDAMTGKQYISSDGQFTSSVADLEEYSTILGESRYFTYVLTHPNKDCPLLTWLLRIYPEMKDKQAPPTPSPTLTCTCPQDYIVDVHEVKDWPEEKIWSLIQQERPNYFNQLGKPNGEAKRLFDLFRADLLGLVADYSLTPQSDVYIELGSENVVDFSQPIYDTPYVSLEVDILEKALTYRAVLRATAAKILRQMDFAQILKEELGDDFILTELERDTLLRLVYSPEPIAGIQFDPESNWYGYLSVVKSQVLSFLRNIKALGKSSEERASLQQKEAMMGARVRFDRLRTGDLKVINQYNEDQVDVSLDAHAEVLASLLNNDYKQSLFLMYVEAEQRSGEDNPDEVSRLSMKKLVSILTPIFTDANFPVGEEEYNAYLSQADELGFYSTPKVVEHEEEFHG